MVKKRVCHCGFGVGEGASCVMVEGEDRLRRKGKNLVALRRNGLGLERVSCITGFWRRRSSRGRMARSGGGESGLWSETWSARSVEKLINCYTIGLS